MTAPVTTPAREQEAQAVDAVFYAVLLELGVETLEDALALWQDVPAGSTVQTAAAWLDRAVALVMARRGQSRELAIAYYRLARALRTGRTVQAPDDPEPTTVTLSELRFEFERLVQDVEEAPERPAVPLTPPTRTEDTPEPLAGSEGVAEDVGGDSELIPVEDGVDWQAIEEDLAEQAEEEAREVLATLGPVHQERLTQKINRDEPATTVDAARDQAHQKAGARQASAAEHVALNGARGTLYVAGGRDARVIGYVRVSRTGTPCGFCAMLISRGPMLKGVDRQSQVYGSEQSATVRSSDGDQYHHNCKCYALPIYSLAHFNTDPKFDLNREYGRLWPIVTAGLSGADAFRAWRNYIDGLNRDEQNPTPTTATAQAA